MVQKAPKRSSAKRYMLAASTGGLYRGIFEISGRKVRHVEGWGPLTFPTLTGDPEKDLLTDLNAGMGSTQFTLRRMTLKPNSYHPRVWRPTFNEFEFPTRDDEARQGLAQLVYLIRQLESILEVVEPSKRNLKVWGHAIRNVLMVACTEVEAQLSGVLTANSYQAKRRSTVDYVKLKGPLRLGEYSVQMAHFPEAGRFSPFASWNPQSPTQSLAWYDAYNQVKHDREKNFSAARLDHTINAISACLILLYAQHGHTAFTRDEPFTFFRLVGQPMWPGDEQYYSVRGVTGARQQKLVL